MAQGYFVDEVLRQGVTQLNLLDLEETAVVNQCTRCGILIHVVSASTGYGAVRIIYRPTVVVEHFLQTVRSSVVGTVDTVENLVAVRTGSEYGQVDALIGRCEGETIGEVGNGIADAGQVAIRYFSVAIQILEQRITRLLVDAGKLIAAEVVNGIALLEVGDGVSVEVATAQAGDRGIDVGHLIAQSREVGTDAVVEVADMVAPAQFKLKSLVLNVTGIHR